MLADAGDKLMRKLAGRLKAVKLSKAPDKTTAKHVFSNFHSKPTAWLTRAGHKEKEVPETVT